MKTFKPVHEYLPEGISGNVRIEHFDISPQESDRTRTSAIIRGYAEYIPAGRYTRLLVDNEVMMSDTPMEHRSNIGVVIEAKGDVLIAGLGLGMILYPIAVREKVRSITVIEQSPDVVRLVAPYLPEKVRVITADIFKWKPKKGVRYDTLYWDIWPTVNEENLTEIATLNRRFARCKNDGAWVNAWQREELLYRRRQSARYAW